MTSYNSQVWGALVAHAVNSLEDDPQDLDPCCPHTCGPCAALKILHDDGALDAFIRPYLEFVGGTWSWWDEDADTFRWNWVTDRWCDPETCEDKDLADTPS